MSFFGNKISYDDIVGKFGISNGQAEELDMLDGKKDNNFNGTSLFNILQESKNEYEANAMNKFKFSDLFSYIKNTLSEKAEKLHLKAKADADNISKELISQIFGFGKAKLQKPISEINSSNVVEVLSSYKEKSDKYNLHIDDETLIEAILDENIGDDKKKEYINHIKNALVERLHSLCGDSTEIEQLFSKAVDTALEKHWPFQNSKMLDSLVNKFVSMIEQMESIKNSNNSDKSARLLENLFLTSAEEFNALLKNLGLENDVYGNGYFDNKAKQTSGSCWIHAGINNIMQSPKGKQYINNLIYKNQQNGSITVYLPGAKENEQPQPKGDGMYTYTKKEIEDEMFDSSIGDGDYTAFVLAIQDYRKATNTNFEEGGGFSEFNQIIFGEENSATAYVNCSSNTNRMYNDNIFRLKGEFIKKYEKSKNSKYEKEYEKDYKKYKIQVGLIEISQIQDVNKHYEKICELFNDDNYVLHASILNENESDLPQGRFDSGSDFETITNHAYTIRDMQKDKVILEESNNPGVPITYSIEDFMKTFDITAAKLP